MFKVENNKHIIDYLEIKITKSHLKINKFSFKKDMKHCWILLSNY